MRNETLTLGQKCCETHGSARDRVICIDWPIEDDDDDNNDDDDDDDELVICRAGSTCMLQ